MGRYSDNLFNVAQRRMYAKTPREFGGQKGTPDPKLKGVRGGNCNVTHCQAPGAFAWSMNNRAYYCDDCARTLNRANHDYYKREYGVDRFVFRIDTLTPEERAAWAAKNAHIPDEA